MKQVKKNIVSLLELVEQKIYILPEKEIDAILDESKTPIDEYSLFLKHSYTQLNNLLMECNKLS